MAMFYANENFPFPVVEALRLLGHDVVTTQESGRAGLAIPDDEVLAYTIQQQRIVLTLNRKHFIRLHRDVTYHFGIVVCTFDFNFAALAQRIDTAVRVQGTMNGMLVRVNRPS